MSISDREAAEMYRRITTQSPDGIHSTEPDLEAEAARFGLIIEWLEKDLAWTARTPDGYKMAAAPERHRAIAGCLSMCR